jgi:RNA polymerase-binding transcription factor DksA
MIAPLQMTRSHIGEDEDRRIDALARLRGQLVASRDEQAARLAEVTVARDAGVLDEHAEVSAVFAWNLVDEIEQTLARIDRGVYGTCESCGAMIAAERLKAIPHVRSCIACASRIP